MHFVGGATRNGKHYAKDYTSTATFPGWRKVPFSELKGEARAAAAYPQKRQIAGVRLSDREFSFVKMLSCKSRIVFWLYCKFKWPARAVAEAFGTAILDQHSVYIRARPIKRALFVAANENKTIDWAEIRALFEDGASEQELCDFYGLSPAAVRRNLRG
jgi:hypothetical protein